MKEKIITDFYLFGRKLFSLEGKRKIFPFKSKHFRIIEQRSAMPTISVKNDYAKAIGFATITSKEAIK